MELSRFGRGVRALRIRKRWRQEDLAQEAGVSRSVVGRLERGEPGGLRLDAVDAIVVALGAVADLRLRWNGEALGRLLDEGHARLVDVVVRRLVALGWGVAVEVTFSRYGERGSTDVLAFHSNRRVLVVIEVKSVTPDMQAMLGGIDRRARLSPQIAREPGWSSRVTGRLLVVWDTRTNRRRLERNAATVDAALPARTREVARWLADPAGEGIAGVWLVTPPQGMDATCAAVRRVRRLGLAASMEQVAPGERPVPDPDRRPPGALVRCVRTTVRAVDG